MGDIYYGGQIKDNYRGNLASIVMKGLKNCGAFMCPTDSEEYYYLTGVGEVLFKTTQQSIIKRIYIGVNREACEYIAKSSRFPKDGKIDLRNIDVEIVYSSFLGKRKGLEESFFNSESKSTVVLTE